MRVRIYLVTHKKGGPPVSKNQNENITHPLHYITVNYFTANSILTKSERMRFWTLQRKLILNPRRFWAIQRELLSNRRRFWAIQMELISNSIRFWAIPRELLLNRRRFWAIQMELLSNRRRVWAIKGNFDTFEAQLRNFKQD